VSLAQRQAERLAATLDRSYGGLEGVELLRAMSRDVFPGRLAVVASFGAESALLLALVAEVDASLPVIFLDTGQHFPETLAYRDLLEERLGLSDIRSVQPDMEARRRADPDDTLWRRDPDGCCHLRKVVPLQQALADFDAWVTGRKQYHGGGRDALRPIEAAEGRIKINPLIHWDRDRVDRGFAELDLPRHPLESKGYLSIGCQPCTRAVMDEEDLRAGRWAGCGKSECGIHWTDAGAHGPMPAPSAPFRASPKL
jgi:phosphoadenosine phosphosulfate reductase